MLLTARVLLGCEAESKGARRVILWAESRQVSGRFFTGAPCGSSRVAVIFFVHFCIQTKMHTRSRRERRRTAINLIILHIDARQWIPAFALLHPIPSAQFP